MYLEWQDTCSTALDMLCELLPLANTSPELVEFMSNHDIDLEVRNILPVIRVWQVDAHILAFLSVSLFIILDWCCLQRYHSLHVSA